VALSRWELQLGTSGVAAPVFGAGGRVTGALEVRLGDPRSQLPLVRPALLVAARALSRELALSQLTDRHPNGWPLRNGDNGHKTDATQAVSCEPRVPAGRPYA